MKKVFKSTRTITPSVNNKDALVNKIKEYNKDKVDPELLFIKGSKERKMLLNGELSFPLPWATESKYYPGVINTEGLTEDSFIKRMIKEDIAFVKLLLKKREFKVTIYTLYACLVDDSSDALDLVVYIFDNYETIGIEGGLNVSHLLHLDV